MDFVRDHNIVLNHSQLTALVSKYEQNVQILKDFPKLMDLSGGVEISERRPEDLIGELPEGEVLDSNEYFRIKYSDGKVSIEKNGTEFLSFYIQNFDDIYFNPYSSVVILKDNLEIKLLSCYETAISYDFDENFLPPRDETLEELSPQLEGEYDFEKALRVDRYLRYDRNVLRDMGVKYIYLPLPGKMSEEPYDVEFTRNGLDTFPEDKYILRNGFQSYESPKEWCQGKFKFSYRNDTLTIMNDVNLIFSQKLENFLDAIATLAQNKIVIKLEDGFIFMNEDGKIINQDKLEEDEKIVPGRLEPFIINGEYSVDTDNNWAIYVEHNVIVYEDLDEIREIYDLRGSMFKKDRFTLDDKYLFFYSNFCGLAIGYDISN